LAYEKASGKVEIIDQIELPNVTIKPQLGDEIFKDLWLPSGVEEFGDVRDLAKEIQDFLKKWIDLDEEKYWQASWYIIGSWLYDKYSTVGYIRFVGDHGSGKGRGLDAIGRLCYKAIRIVGAVTPAPLYRLVRKWEGTLAIDETEYKFESDQMIEILQILKCGFERGSSVIRCNKEDPNVLEILPVYGPKLFASEVPFPDPALESRCLRFVMEVTNKHFPKNLGRNFYKAAQKIRNKLLWFRLTNYDKIATEFLEDPDIDEELNLDPRLLQIGLPFSAVFRHLPDVMEEYRKVMMDTQATLNSERSNSYKGQIVQAIFDLARTLGKDYITPAAIANYCKDTLGIEKIDSRSVGRQMVGLKLKTEIGQAEGKRARYLVWKNDTMRKLMRRYIDPDAQGDYASLFVKEVKAPDLEI